MDSNSQPINDFERVLKNNAERIPLALYNDNKHADNQHILTQKPFSARDIILNVNRQIKAIQKADVVLPRKRDKNTLDKHIKSTFLPVNMLPREVEVTHQKPANKFETQCVSDTQLIDIIDNAEAISNANDGITQEFDRPFCEIDRETKESLTKNYTSIANDPIPERDLDSKKETSSENGTMKHESHKLIEIDKVGHKSLSDISSIDENISTNTEIRIRKELTQTQDYSTQFNEIPTETSSKHFAGTNINKHKTHIDRLVADDIITPSPVFQVPKSKSPSPLIFDLNSFENFEKIALPIIEENPDLTSAKRLINSQIIGKELHIGVNVRKNKEPTSPIISSLEKINFTQTSEEMINNANENRDKIAIHLDKGNNEPFLQDEILFSSDEETEYIHKELQDIPLTCALETSFYEQPNILDTTMYVGFQTASNRSIQINTDSFSKAKTLLDEIEKEVASSSSITELVERISSIDNVSHNNSKTNLKEDSTNTELRLELNNKDYNAVKESPTQVDAKDKHYLDNKDEIPTRAEKRKFDGFMTASKKKIKLSDMALARCKRVFQDIDLEEDFSDSKPIDEEINKNKNELMNSHIDDDILLEFSRDMSMIDEEKYEAHDFVGFKTASKKDIKVSQEALTKTKSFFDDIAAADDFNKPTTSKDLCGFKSANCKEIKISEAALLKGNAVFKDITKSNEEDISKNSVNVRKSAAFVGFKTANNKDIKVSKQALFKSKDIFKDIDNVGNDKQIACTNVSNKHCLDIADLNEDLTDLSTVFENEIMDIEMEPKPLGGFKTASNKPIKVSEKALLNSKRVFNDIDLDGNCGDNDHVEKVLSKPAILKKCQTESITTNQDKNLIEYRSLRQLPSENSYMSFKTANNKPINISKLALEKSKKMFEDLEVIKDVYNEEEELIPFRGFQSTYNKPAIRGSDESETRSKNINDDIDKPLFHTANNKPVSVSSEDCKDSLSNISTDGTSSVKKPIDVPIFKGFQTANNEVISVSAEALARSKSLFKDIDCENDLKKKENDIFKESTEINLPFKGFQTASNKQIGVSSEALAKSKLLFKDIDNDVENKSNDSNYKQSEHVFKGFQTANKRPVTVSIQALKRSKQLFKDIDQDNDGTCINVIGQGLKELQFEGFKTGNQKTIKVSAAALAKSKAVLKDIANDDNDFNKNLGQFKGFQTGNNKLVIVSEDAILKSKKIFEHEDGFKENALMTSQFKGFQTASNKRVSVSEQALKKSRQIFQDIDISKENNLTEEFNIPDKEHFFKSQTFKLEGQSKNEFEKSTKPTVQSRHGNEEKLLDTQMVNAFEDTLYTEDFCKTVTPRQSKRSGSPILSCPKAKKRKKFETPYRNDSQSIKTTELKTVNKKPDSDMIFNCDYKKNKRLKLKDLARVEEKTAKTLKDPHILNFSLETFVNFQFKDKRNDLTVGNLTVQDMKVYFEKSVNKNFIPIGWIENHIKLIIWKLISYEIRFPNTLSGVCKTKNVLEQLKYRYDRELYNAERPALRKILEKDDVASKTMVLCVAGIFVDGVNVKSVPSISSNVELLLTDGWYCVKTCIDKMLTKLVYDEKIIVGCKIVTTGAELLNCEQGVSPWEDTSSVRLKIFGNSTRPARWDARLGYHGNPAILAPLSTVKCDGGKVSKLRLFVARVYPMLYVEKFEDGSTVTRSERLEHIHQGKYEMERQAAMEKLYEEVEKEISDQESQDSLSSQVAAKHQKALSDSRITESQAKSIEDRSCRKRERLLLNIQERVRKKIGEQGLDIGRNLVTLLKVRVAGVDVKDGVTVTKGLMSIWKPNDLMTEIIKEGAWIEVMNVVPTAVRYSEIHLSAGRQSIFSQSQKQEDDITIPYTESFKRICHPIKDLARNPTMTTDYNEIDTIGLIFQIDEETNQPFQNMYLTDADKNIVCINFWGGLKKFGFQNILEVGQIIYGTNLQKRAGNTRKSIPHFRVTEFTFFTKTPKNFAARSSIADLEKKFTGIDKRRYCNECVVLKNNFSVKSYAENISPYRFNNDHNLTKNKVFIESPLAANCDNFNLTGLDFESTFKQTGTQDLSPKALQRKRLVRQKIAKLKMIGEPPPLSPFHIINKSKSAFNSFKSPLAETSVANVKKIYQNSRIDTIQSSPIIQSNVSNIGQDSRTNSSPLIQMNSKISYKKDAQDVQSNPLIQNNVASIKKRYQNSRITNDDIQSSPVFSMNRTYVKNVNPVKLNFSDAQDNSVDDVVDHFAEDFDGSPPLSLD